MVGRTSGEQITIFKTVGSAVLDVVVATEIVKKAKRFGKIDLLNKKTGSKPLINTFTKENKKTVIKMRLQPFCFIWEEIDRVYDCIGPFKGTWFCPFIQ